MSTENTDTQTETRTAKDPTETILSKSALNDKYLCDYVLNVASGCRHGCKFCYVPNTPNIRTRGEMLNEQVDVDDGQAEWGDYVLYRDDIPDRLPGILERKRTWHETDKGQGIVGISFHTDCFMDRRAAQITIGAIEALVEDDRYVRILTRNPMLATNYLDVFQEAGDNVIVGSSIPTLDEGHIDAIEPDAPPIAARLRGLERFAEAGVPVYISMSPTYPTIETKDEMRDLMTRLAQLDPEVIFHEPINPRGSNYEMTVAAAEEAGQDDLASALVDVQGPESWVRYGCQHFRWVQQLGEDLGVPVHLWPDKQLVQEVPEIETAWLEDWLDRQSPEEFAGRNTPDDRPMQPPRPFSWERKTTITQWGQE